MLSTSEFTLKSDHLPLKRYQAMEDPKELYDLERSDGKENGEWMEKGQY